MIKILKNVFNEEYLKEIFFLFSEEKAPKSLKKQDIQDELFYKLSKSLLMEYCIERNIQIENINLSVSHAINIGNYLDYQDSLYFEPHHDIKEGIDFITLLYVDYDEDCKGGETVFYHDFSSINYPENQTVVNMEKGKVVIFPAEMVHRIKPYFGDKPRKTISLGWNV